MNPTSCLSLLLSTLTLTHATTISYDQGYDDGSRSLNAIACSDGPNGLEKNGWQTQSQIPSFPYIAGSDTIPGWNSDQCGQCFAVTYNGKTVHVLAVDHAGAGINMSLEAMNALTAGQAQFLGRVDAVVDKVGVDQCGLTPSRRGVEFNA